MTIDGAPYTISSRYTYSGEPVQKAGRFVGERLAALGLGVEYHVWGTFGTSTYSNVIGQLTGTTNPNDIYIIGAHLDNLPSSGLAYGADDNGSGSVATLLAAEILSQYQWNCTLRFAFWTGEEQGMLGSAAYATRAKNANENIKGYLNMDMIAFNGSAPNEIDLFAKSSVPGSVAMMDLYADAIAAYGLNLVPTKYTNDSLGDRSDNKSFWDKGFASMLAIEDYYGDFNTRYHSVNDRLQYLDMAYYTDFVKASLATFAHMTGGPSGPLAVSLASFEAAPASGGVQLSWETVSEIDNTGFNVYRSLTAAQPEQLLAFVPSQAPGGTQGAAYAFLDSDVVAGQTLWYWLEDVAFDGSTALHGPVSVQYLAPSAVTVPERWPLALALRVRGLTPSSRRGWQLASSFGRCAASHSASAPSFEIGSPGSVSRPRSGPVTEPGHFESHSLFFVYWLMRWCNATALRRPGPPEAEAIWLQSGRPCGPEDRGIRSPGGAFMS